VVSTDAALHFFKREDVLAEVLTDHDEWAVGYKLLLQHGIVSIEEVIRSPL
jgi:hypothetical protein